MKSEKYPYELIDITVTTEGNGGDQRFIARCMLGCAPISGQAASSINAAIAELINKANVLGGWTPIHFDLNKFGVTGRLNEQTGRYQIGTRFTD